MKKFLVLSDLHAYAALPSGASPPSHLKVDTPIAAGDMIMAVRDTLRKEGIKPDCIICPGDLADRADPVAQANVWQRLNWLKDQLEAPHLIAATGNHDIDSRLAHSDFDPKGTLQALEPSFPGGSEEEVDRYWSRNFVIYRFGNVRILNLNSSAFHGIGSANGKTDVSEYMKGRVSKNTCDSIAKSLASDDFEYNILVTHHHVYKNDDIYDNDHSEMIGAGKLLKTIQASSKNPWLIIHGHQHYPRLEYYIGGSDSAIVFSAGSLSAKIDAQYSGESPNQFYYLEISEGAGNWSPCGEIKAWHWVKREGWQRSPASFNIPYGCGFGCRDNVKTVAFEIFSQISDASEPFVTLKYILEKVPNLKYVLPTERKKIIDHVIGMGVIAAIMPDSDPDLSTFRKAAL